MSNTQTATATRKLEIEPSGAISSLTASNSWDWAFGQPGAGGPKRRYEESETARELVDKTPSARPSNADDYTVTVANSIQALFVSDTKTPAETVFVFRHAPEALNSDGPQETASWTVKLAAGESKVIEFIMVFARRAKVEPLALRWAREFDLAFADAKQLGENRYAHSIHDSVMLGGGARLMGIAFGGFVVQ